MRADVFDAEKRSAVMRAVKSRDTKPELAVRAAVRALGYGRRYRIGGAKLPGKPDLVFGGMRKVIFVHGCFWHRHGPDCPLTRMPKSRQDFWAAKFEENIARDADVQRRLLEQGWQYLIVWECETRKFLREGLTAKIAAFLDS